MVSTSESRSCIALRATTLRGRAATTSENATRAGPGAACVPYRRREGGNGFEAPAARGDDVGGRGGRDVSLRVLVRARRVGLSVMRDSPYGSSGRSLACPDVWVISSRRVGHFQARAHPFPGRAGRFSERADVYPGGVPRVLGDEPIVREKGTTFLGRRPSRLESRGSDPRKRPSRRGTRSSRPRSRSSQPVFTSASPAHALSES